MYTIHEKAGHLGIFVSGGVARKSTREFSSNIDLIDLLPPGLYEARFERKSEGTASPDLVSGDWVMHCEIRTLDDIRALGGNNAADERGFAAAAKLSEVNLAFYRTFVQPFVRLAATPAMAEWMRRLHPLRLPYEGLSDTHPLAVPIETTAAWVRQHRTPAAADNPYLALQENASRLIISALDGWRDLRDNLAELTFLAIYGSSALQVALGIDPADTGPFRKAGKDPIHRELVEARIADLKSGIQTGGLLECAVRGLLYVGMAGSGPDPRAFEAIRRIRQDYSRASQLTLADFKAMVRDQYFMLLIDREAAIAAIPALLPPDADLRRKACEAIKRVLSAPGEVTGEAAARLTRITQLFEVEAGRGFRKAIAPPIVSSVDATKAS